MLSPEAQDAAFQATLKRLPNAKRRHEVAAFVRAGVPSVYVLDGVAYRAPAGGWPSEEEHIAATVEYAAAMYNRAHGGCWKEEAE